MADDRTIKERLGVVEVIAKDNRSDIKEVRSDVKEILENHLPHIRAELEVAKMKLALLVGVASAVAMKLLDHFL